MFGCRCKHPCLQQTNLNTAGGCQRKIIRLFIGQADDPRDHQISSRIHGELTVSHGDVQVQRPCARILNRQIPSATGLGDQPCDGCAKRRITHIRGQCQIATADRRVGLLNQASCRHNRDLIGLHVACRHHPKNGGVDHSAAVQQIRDERHILDVHQSDTA